jgi:CYTH domain-containing protein
VTNRTPGEGRYAHVEREQRWVVAGVPEGAQRVADIADSYIVGTRLRLRRANSDAGVDYKLGQKVRADERDPEVVKLTNIYLSVDEYTVFAALDTAEIHKTRWHANVGPKTVAVDQFHGRYAGLFLAEVELAAGERLLPRLDFALADVTHDDRYSGGSLAFASDVDAAQLLRASVEQRGAV